MSLVGMNDSSNAQFQRTDADSPSDEKMLVAYFSCTGTTGRVAQTLAKILGGDLYRITPAEAYTAADLDWTDKSSRSSVEMADSIARPALDGKPLAGQDYDLIFLGYPIWWDLCPRPVNTFLEQYDFSGKTIVPFATSGSSLMAHSVQQLKTLYPSIIWKEGCLLNGGLQQAESWAKSFVGN